MLLIFGNLDNKLDVTNTRRAVGLHFLWLVLGMNDLTRTQCSEEIVVLGILRVVEEIRLRKPDAMVNYQDGSEPKMADVADFTADRAHT